MRIEWTRCNFMGNELIDFMEKSGELDSEPETDEGWVFLLRCYKEENPEKVRTSLAKIRKNKKIRVIDRMFHSDFRNLRIIAYCNIKIN